MARYDMVQGYISVDYRESGSIRKAWNSSTKSSEVKVNPARKKSPSRRSLRTVDQTLNSKTTTNGQATTVDIGKWRGTENGKSKLSRSMDFGLSKQGPLSKMSSSLARSPLSVDKSAANSRILSQSANESPTLKLVRRKLGKSADRQASRYENAFENSIHRAEGQGTVEENCSDTESSSSGSLSVASIVNLRPRATAVPAHFWQDSTTSMKQLRVLGPSRSLTPIRATRSGTSTPQYPSSPSCQSRPTQVLSPLRSSASPMRTRAGNPMLMPQLSLNGRRSNTPFLPNISFELYKNRQTTGQQDEAHDLRLLNNRWLQWRFINAQTEVAMEMQAVTAECSLHSCLLRTNDLRISVASKLIEINKIKQAKKLESLIAANAERLEQWETMRSAHLTALCGLINALQAAIMRVPLIGGPKIDIQATKAILFSAIDIMNGLDEVIRKFLQKAEMVDAFLSELANTILMEKTCLFESRDLLAAAAALEMEERSLRAYIIQQEKEKMVGK
ncbi:hypothetical protein KP509_38G042500 [Ceratopteris richardii]|uniref:QWRF motif-containing protein 3 n=1 Tax=Ceratopteris richardii TaxID=49495 RepID=A0A8T2Q470_CERRI|nr:hypothetical protein KP509_38G042500 [Ceratopteris richardii]